MSNGSDNGLQNGSSVVLLTSSESSYHSNASCEPEDSIKLLQCIAQMSAASQSTELQIIANKYLQEVTKAPYVFLIPLVSSAEEGIIQVIGDRVLEKEIRFPLTPSDLMNIAEHGFHTLISDANKEFTEVIEMVVGNEHNTMIFDIKKPCPLNSDTSVASEESTLAAAIENGHQSPPCLFVCIGGDTLEECLYEYHVRKAFKYILGPILSAIEVCEERRVRNQCQNLLRVARRLLGKIGDVGKLLRGAMTEAKEMTNAERCSLFLIDDETGDLVSRVFDGDESCDDIRIQPGKGVAGHVAQTGKLLNIRNAYQHPLFWHGLDDLTGFKTKNILCFPICDEERIIGVAQLCNKLDGFHFDKCDEEIATAFSIYCGVSIVHSLIHKKVQEAEARHKLSQELLLYHMKVSNADVDELLAEVNCEISGIDDFGSFKFLPRDMDDEATVKMSYQMFADLELISRFKLRQDKLARLLLFVKKGYRETIPYHNWMHAFSVAHFAYALLINLRLVEREIITELQALTFLIACFCHDLDHRGTNNSYQMESQSVLANLYSSEGSVNERHHVSQAICILNEDQCKVLDSLSTDQFKECISTMKDLILATDLGHHFEIIDKLKNLTPDNLADNQLLLMSLLITCSDLSDQIKPWPNPVNVADLVYAEFFAQGDMEKKMGLNPNQMMDRTKACIPKLQIDFITSVIRPTYQILSDLFPEVNFLMDIINDNCHQWELLHESSVN